jgi:hypothetical protein
MLQHLLSLPKSHLIVREIASILEMLPFEKVPTTIPTDIHSPTNALARLLAHDLMLNESKGIKLLRENKYDPTPILKLMDMPFLKRMAGGLGYTGDLNLIPQPQISASSSVNNLTTLH